MYHIFKGTVMHKITHHFVFLCTLISLLLSDTTYTYNYQSSYLETSQAVHTPANPNDLLILAHSLLQGNEPNGGVLLPYIKTFLQQACCMDSHREFILVTLRLFNNKLKGAEYINASTFENFLSVLPNCFEKSIVIEKINHYLRNPYGDETMFNRFMAITHNIMYQQFSTNYDTFKANPDQFLLRLSEEISEIAHAEAQVEQLRHTIVRFLEIALSKLVWNPYDSEQTWESVKSISNHLACLVERNILADVNQLDDLYWSLLYRYCYFIDVATPMLPSTFFKTIKEDIASHQILFLELDEQDPLMQSKLKHLQQVIFNTEAKALAQQEGIITG